MLRILTPNWGSGKDDHVKVQKSKFVCRVCMTVLQQDKALIMPKCHCKYTLIHQECEIKWFKNTRNRYCDTCKQATQNIPLTLTETIENYFPMLSPESESARSPSMTLGGSIVPEMECKFLIVKVKRPHTAVVGSEQDEKIPKLEAICKICFDMLQQNSVDVLIKTKCRCKFTLMHEKCAKNKENNKCDVCEEDVETIPIILSSPNMISIENTGSTRKRIMNKISRLFKGIGKA